MLKEVKKALQITDNPAAASGSQKMSTESTAVEETTVVMVENEDVIADDRTDMEEFCNSIRESTAFENDFIMGAIVEQPLQAAEAGASSVEELSSEQSSLCF